MRYPFAIIVCMAGLPLLTAAQGPPLSVPDQFFRHITSTSAMLQQKLEQSTGHYLQKLTRIEQKLQRKLARKDSLAARRLFPGDGAGRYQQWAATATGGSLYIPYLDTLGTSLRFLQCHPQLLDGAGALPGKIMESLGSLRQLESSLQQADDIKKIILQRQQYLTQQLQDLGFVKELKQLNKQAYYYAQQVGEYKALLKDPGKAGRKVMDLLSKTEAFQNFMRRNSRLASLFRLPGSDDDPSAYIRYASLQTRDQVNTLLQQQLAADGQAARQQLQQQLQTAQAEMGKLKDKFLSSPTGNGAGIPSFKPNNQKTKTFKQRLELGSNLQSQRATTYFPVTTDIGLSLGYKLNDRSVAGVGASYKVGWGSGWNNIRVTHQGAGIRSFLDWKIRNSYWFSGGFEYNYRPLAFNTASPTAVPPQHNEPGTVWQQSALIGLSRKYQVGKKFKGRMQLLWDFLSYQQLPRSQPIVFRVGYDLK